MANSKISDLLSQARQILDLKGVSSSKLDALILLSYALSFSKEQIVFNPDFKVSPVQEEVFLSLIERRSKREPVSHIIGKREFFGEDFIVSKDVLDPRPDSEILIEAVLKKFPNRNQKLKILELGVGSGCLIITLLRAFAEGEGCAVDISDKALEISKKNAEKHRVNSRLNLLESDLFSAIEGKFDIIISNPPYIAPQDIEQLEPEVRIYEPRQALDGGLDGLDFYRKIAASAKNFLNENGRIFLEIGFGQKEKIIEIFTKSEFLFIESKPDLAGIERVLEFKI